MRRVKKVRKLLRHRLGESPQVRVIGSLKAMGYTEEEAYALLHQGRVLEKVGPTTIFLFQDTELYVLDSEEESTETEEFVDRGHLVDLE